MSKENQVLKNLLVIKKIATPSTIASEVVKVLLQKTKIIDPSCGSGAFLIAAYNYLLRQYERVNLALVSFNETPLNRTEINQVILKK